MARLLTHFYSLSAFSRASCPAAFGAHQHEIGFPVLKKNAPRCFFTGFTDQGIDSLRDRIVKDGQRSLGFSIQDGHNELRDIHQIPFCRAGANVNPGIIFVLKIRYFSIRLRGQTVDFLLSFHALGVAQVGMGQEPCAFLRPATGNTHAYW